MTDGDLGRLLTETAEAVTPADRLGAIRAEATRREAARERQRRYVGGGALIAAAAATVVAVMLVPTGRGTDPARPGPTGEGPTATDGGQRSVTAYYVGDTPRGPRLYQEPVTVDGSLDPVDAALEALMTTPDDPDYRTPWPSESFVDATVTSDAIRVEASSAVYDVLSISSAEEPGRLDLAEQQVVYSLQHAAGKRLPVLLDVEDRPVGPLTAKPATEVMSLMNVTWPSEGMEVTDAFTAAGLSNGFEGTYTWELRRGDEQGPVVRNGYGTADGCCDDRLHPWAIQHIDVSTLTPGRYTFVIRNTDPSGREGFAPDSDDRTIVVEPSGREPSPVTEPSATAPDDSQLVPVYFLGDTPDGPRLFSEIHAVTPPSEGQDAVLEPLNSTPSTRTTGPRGPPASSPAGASTASTTPATSESPSPAMTWTSVLLA